MLTFQLINKRIYWVIFLLVIFLYTFNKLYILFYFLDELLQLIRLIQFRKF